MNVCQRSKVPPAGSDGWHSPEGDSCPVWNTGTYFCKRYSELYGPE
ncbi:hypothetical protein B4100_3914 [Heyndrickxia coagulans]|nr:hypothetical protein B4100_3914 [Heyndrickxia coagulans]